MNTSSHRPDLAAERRARIAEIVNTRGSVRLVDLVEPMGVSEPTLRKDLTILEQERKLKRTHGGALALTPVRESRMSSRHTVHEAEKDRIARYCLAMIDDDSSAFFDSGTTIARMAQLMERPANVITNSVPVAPILADKPRIRHTLLGGQYRTLGESLTGPVAVMGLEQFTVDIAFIGVGGLTAEGVTVTDVAEKDIKQVAMTRARRVVVPMDSSKIGTVCFCRLSDLAQIDDLVTDSPSVELERWCGAAGVRLHIAD